MSDLTVTAHALERMEQRWPELTDGLTDEEVARVIQGEINDALIAGRWSTNCPLELANKNLANWRVQKGRWYVWNSDKSRGYCCADDPDGGIIVLTTLIGEEPEKAREKLKDNRRKRHR